MESKVVVAICLWTKRFYSIKMHTITIMLYFIPNYGDGTRGENWKLDFSIFYDKKNESNLIFYTEFFCFSLLLIYLNSYQFFIVNHENHRKKQTHWAESHSFNLYRFVFCSGPKYLKMVLFNVLSQNFVQRVLIYDENEQNQNFARIKIMAIVRHN